MFPRMFPANVMWTVEKNPKKSKLIEKCKTIGGQAEVLLIAINDYRANNPKKSKLIENC